MFPVIHSLLDAKITNVLSLCHDKTILAAVQCIIQNMISCEDTSQQQLHFLQSGGFGGLWRFAGFFTKSNCNAENVELFVNCLEALVETCLPLDETDHELSQYPSMLSGEVQNLQHVIGAPWRPLTLILKYFSFVKHQALLLSHIDLPVESHRQVLYQHSLLTPTESRCNSQATATGCFNK